MKRSAIKWRVIRAAACLVSAGLLTSRPAQAQDQLGREYDKVVALLVDYQRGLLAVGGANDDEDKIEKKVFKIDTRSVDIINPANQYFEFAEIKPGHRLDIITEIGPGGRERVFEIMDYNLQETS